ncbi:MAG: AraC family transcriptional regulator [Rhodoferax sp.]|uniref:helix-turn-helix domain-containing protein n=1 Tax=Rhodoferax sp. TaxID=50421 RepID=UPI0026379186|nr:AraC family transcriptional regulator [Rhodoferax sp.]MDD5332456.1 AraC family transcriptional regulator [Rhodoferax sp.]
MSLPHDQGNQVATGTLPHSALIAPRLSLSSCVRAYLTRSTLGANLRPDQRNNYFPASPLCGITWVLQGEAQLIRRGNEWVSEPVPTVSFAGPHTVPVVHANPGPVQAFMLALMPQALRAMAGVNIACHVNRIVPISSVLDASWQAMAGAVLGASDDAARVQVIEAFLEPRWRAVRQTALPRTDRYRYWVEGLALQAASSGIGKSLRQMERRIKQKAGLPLRELRSLARAEESFLNTRTNAASGARNYQLNWATLAADGGFADQSHLCRETRRMSGLSPNELKKAIQEDESFWAYRIWS